MAILLTSSAQLALKLGVESANSPAAETFSPHIVPRLVAQPFVWLGIFLYLGSMVVWLAVLAKLPVGTAYPLLSLGYVLTAVAAYFLFGEKLSTTQIVGILVIVAGVSLLSVGRK